MTTDLPAPDEPSPGLVLYSSPDGSARLQLRIEHKTFWLTQRQLADLSQKLPPTINGHIQNIFFESELLPEATIRKYRIIQAEGSWTVERLVDHYSLDVVIAVGHRVRLARYVVRVLEQVRAERGKPQSIRVDNGPEFISRRLDLWAYFNGVKLDFSRPEKPTDNAVIESFNGKLRGGCLNEHWFLSLDEVARLTAAWREDYNRVHPHASLGHRTPFEFTRRLDGHAHALSG